MKKIRIASGAGYAGDRIEPALDIIQRGDVNYIIFECLAERTIALAQLDKLSRPNHGYNHLLEFRMEKIIPLLKSNPAKIITNMGAANPLAAANKIYEIACANGLSGLKIAVVSGDDVLSSIPNYYNTPIMETGEALSTLSNSIIAANAYIGGEVISKALAEGADIVITGRVADPSLVVGPLMYEFNNEYDDYNFLGQCTLAGHLLECAGQATGGYFADPGIKDVPELWNLGFPIVDFCCDGTFTIEKLPNTGGLINAQTLTEQLLYEVQNPANYITPDVCADFSQVVIKELAKDKALLSGAKGKTKPTDLKVSVGYLDGWIAEGEISYGCQNAEARANLAGEIVRKRVEMLNIPYKKLRVDLIGVNSLYNNTTDNLYTPKEIKEVRLRVAAQVDTKELADKICWEVEALYTNGPAGGGGVRKHLHQVVAVSSILIPREAVHTQVDFIRGD